MGVMFYIICSLSTNPDIAIQRGGVQLQFFLRFGTYVIAVFSTIFLFFTHGFLMKQRKSEFGLYHVLGMGKRHISCILGLESLLLAVFTIFAGILFGVLLDKLAVMALSAAMDGVSPVGFNLSTKAIILSLLLFSIIHILLYLKSLVSLWRSTAMSLLKSDNVGEREPKAHWVLAILGVACLTTAYYISLTTTDPMQALILFFVAVVLVIIGTYMLFITGSIAWLKMMKAHRGYYYKTQHFINVSFMLYRMKQNAASLASICILSTMVLVMISGTSSLYFGSKNVVKNTFPFEYRTEISTANEISPQRTENLNKVMTKFVSEHGGNPNNILSYNCFNSVMSRISENNYDTWQVYAEKYGQDAKFNEFMVIVTTANDYNRVTGSNLTLNPNEAYFYSVNNASTPKDVTIYSQQFEIMGKVSDDSAQVLFLNNTVFNSVCLVVADDNVLNSLISAHNLRNDGKYFPLKTTLLFDAAFATGTDSFYTDLVDVLHGSSFVEENGNMQTSTLSRTEFAGNFFVIFTGLFFVGIILSILFVATTILIIYYKQISEGIQDVRRFDIMQRVGLSRREIKGSIQSQVMTVFFMPLVVAGVHCAFAFPIIDRILLVMSLNSQVGYFNCVVISFLIFAALYSLVYTLTAKMYYKIVSK